MATLTELETAIESLLNHPLGLGHYQLVRRVESKAYEAYVFGLCLRAARELGAVPTLRGISGAPRPFIFRGGPGQIHSKAKNYGFAEFGIGSEEFEVHAGVEFRGTSGMTHELDVCIINARDARKCRAEPNDPPAASLVGGWECKFYAGPLTKELGRALVGLVDDMGTNIRLSGLCSNSQHRQLRSYFKPQRRPFPHFKLSPLNPSNESIFVNLIKADLQKMTAAP